MIAVAVDRLQGVTCIEHSSAGRTKNVPRHFEEAELGCLQKCSDHLLRIEAVLGRERQHVDAVEVAIVTMLDQLLDLVDGLWIGRLPQSGYKRCLSHECGPL